MRAIGRTVSVVSLVTAGLVVGPAALAEPAYSCDGRPATIVAQSPPGARGPVRIAGTAGDDVIYVPDDGWYKVKAGHGNDLVCGYPDVTYGGTGADTIESTFGQDVTTFTAYGEEGDDTLIAHPTATPNEYHLENVLAGGPGDDVLTGGDQNDQISGGAGTTPSPPAPATTRSPMTGKACTPSTPRRTPTARTMSMRAQARTSCWSAPEARNQAVPT
jgi:hypothetical protein